MLGIHVWYDEHVHYVYAIFGGTRHKAVYGYPATAGSIMTAAGVVICSSVLH